MEIMFLLLLFILVLYFLFCFVLLFISQTQARNPNNTQQVEQLFCRCILRATLNKQLDKENRFWTRYKDLLRFRSENLIEFVDVIWILERRLANTCPISPYALFTFHFLVYLLLFVDLSVSLYRLYLPAVCLCSVREIITTRSIASRKY